MSTPQCLRASWIVPVVPHGSIIEDGAIMIQEGEILDLGTYKHIETRWQPKHVEHYDKHMLIPGLINAHTHSPMTLLRGLGDDLCLQGWLHQVIWPAEKKLLGHDFIHDGTWLACHEMLQSGTTTFNEHYFYPEIAADVLLKSGLRARLGFPVMEQFAGYAASSQECLARAHDAIRNHPTDNQKLHWSLAPHSPYALTNASIEQMTQYALDHQVPVHMHVHETQREVDDSLKEHGQTPISRLNRLGGLNPWLTAVHTTSLKTSDIELLADAQVSIVTCPESNLKLASGFCPVAQLQARGLNLAIGTDGAASNNDLDMLLEMRTTAMLAKAISQDPTAINAHQALAMATIGGARAMHLDHLVGSLEVGKQADMVAVNLDRPYTYPHHQPLSTWLYAGRSSQIEHVWVAGEPLLKAGEPTRWDQQAIHRMAEDWAERTKPFFLAQP